MYTPLYLSLLMFRRFIRPLAFLALFHCLVLGIPIDDEFALARRAPGPLSKPPVPSPSDLAPHLIVPGPDQCMFYTGGTWQAAQIYAKGNGRKILADLDKDGWATPSVTDSSGNKVYAPTCPLSMEYQSPYRAAGVGWDLSDVNAYWKSISEAMADICEGTVEVAFPNDSGKSPADSIFTTVEFEAMTGGPAPNGGSPPRPVTKISRIVLKKGVADGQLQSTLVDGTSVSPLTSQIWPPSACGTPPPWLGIIAV
jgi:hypothetical protein